MAHLQAARRQSINNPLAHFLCLISINKEDSHSYFLLRETLETTLELTFWLKCSDFFTARDCEVWVLGPILSPVSDTRKISEVSEKCFEANTATAVAC